MPDTADLQIETSETSFGDTSFERVDLAKRLGPLFEGAGEAKSVKELDELLETRGGNILVCERDMINKARKEIDIKDEISTPETQDAQDTMSGNINTEYPGGDNLVDNQKTVAKLRRAILSDEIRDTKNTNELSFLIEKDAMTIYEAMTESNPYAQAVADIMFDNADSLKEKIKSQRGRLLLVQIFNCNSLEEIDNLVEKEGLSTKSGTGEEEKEEANGPENNVIMKGGSFLPDNGEYSKEELQNAIKAKKDTLISPS